MSPLMSPNEFAPTNQPTASFAKTDHKRRPVCLDALSKLKTERPLLMILDVRMPGMDGMEVLARAKAEYPALKVIMLTGVVDEWMAQTAISTGAAAYITKPVKPAHLQETIDSVVSK